MDVVMTKLTDCYGDVGPGWRVILTLLHTELERICPEYEVLQVKEKFGGLRAYITGTQEAHDLVHRYEALSQQVCETCGMPGKNKTGRHGWYRTLCPEHQPRQLPGQYRV